MSFEGRDAAFIGPNENQFVILDDDRTGLALYILRGINPLETADKNEPLELDENQAIESNIGSAQGPLQFMLDIEVDRIFSTPIGVMGEKLLVVISNGVVV